MPQYPQKPDRQSSPRGVDGLSSPRGQDFAQGVGQLQGRAEQQTNLPRTPRQTSPPKAKRSRRERVIKIGIIAGVVAAAVVAFLFFFNPFGGSSVDEAKVKIQISGPEEIKSGQEVTFDFKITNENRFNIDEVEMVVNEPAGFIFDKASLETQKKDEKQGYLYFNFGSIGAKQDKTLTISGIVTGRTGAAAKWQARLKYVPDNLNNQFETSADFEYSIALSDIALEVSAPHSLAPGEQFEYEISFRNRADEDLSNLEVRLTYPDNFSFTASEPKPNRSNNVWVIDKIESGQQGSININGALTGLPSEIKTSQVIRAEIGQIDAQDRFILLNLTEASTSLAEPSLVLSQKVDDQSKELIVEPGQEISFEINYRNASQSGLNGVTITELLQPTTIIDESTIKIENNGSYSPGAVTWDSGAIAQLSSLPAGAGGSLEIKFKIREDITVRSEEFVDPKIDCQIKAKAANSEEVMGNTVTVKLKTDLTLAEQVRYVDDNGQTVGSGPIPPKVGQKTVYRIYWRVRNSSSDSLNTRVEATLPTGVTFEAGSRVSVGQNVTYQPLTGKVIWEIGRVPAHIGYLLDPLDASFNVSVTPAANQVGKEVVLLRDVKVAGRDSFSAINLESSAPNATTTMDSDPKYGQVKDHGRVVQ